MLKKKKDDKEFNLKIKSEDMEPGALFIIKRLSGLGFPSFMVGGCIRNLVMKRKIHDWDITTSATPEEILQAFKDFKVIPVGKKFGTVTVVINYKNYQLSTFRSKSRDVSEISEDLRHRDFTINSLACEEGKGIIDYFNGLADIRKKVIKGVENPEERIKEDPLRMLRAIRLGCELNFKIEKNTLGAINNNCELIKKVSTERIRDEFTKILLSKYPQRGMKLLQQLGLLQFIIPELGKDSFEYNLNLVEGLPSELILRLSALLYDINNLSYSNTRKERANKILHRLRFKNSVIKAVNILIQEDWRTIDFSNKKNIRQTISRIGWGNLKNIWELKKVIIKKSQKSKKNKLIKIKKAEQNIKETLQRKPPISIRDLAINGKDLIDLGYKEGEQLGLVLKELLNLVLEKPALNNKKILSVWIKDKRPPQKITYN
jgi:tRNA nucleotidyltransferase (CCA-adding enzyme)